MSAPAPETVTRKQIAEIFQYSRNHASKVYRAILLTVPENERSKFNRRLPRHLVDKYMLKT